MGPDGGKYNSVVNSSVVKTGGGFFMKKDSNEVYEQEFTSVDPFAYLDLFTEEMHYGSLYHNAL